MFDLSVNIEPAIEVLRQVRAAVYAVSDVVKAQVEGPIRAHVEQDVTRLLSIAPPQPSGEFQFATRESRIRYIIMRKQGAFALQDKNLPWQRTGAVEGAWVVTIDPRSTSVNAVLAIENIAQDELGRSYSEAVYGPDPVPGHEATGWGRILDEALPIIADGVDYDLLEALQNAFSEYRT